MNYNELLAKLVNGYVTYEKEYLALRAVVELHRPFQFETAPNEYKLVCSVCQHGVIGDVFPCETIQRIEKVLQ